MIQRFTAWEVFLMIAAPIALVALLLPIILVGYKYVSVNEGMKAYDAKLMCGTGRIARVQFSDSGFQYSCSGIIYGSIYLIGLPIGKEWKRRCILDVEFNHGKVSSKKLCLFSEL